MNQPDPMLASRFVTAARRRHPDLTEAALAQARARGAIAAEIDAAIAALGTGADDAGVMRVLRRARDREMARIAWRDLAGLAELDETLGDLSDLADAACDAALRHALVALRARFGEPRDAEGAAVTPVVLGMGKLGGRELNFSSDIDLIFCHTASGETDGRHALDNTEFFGRAAQQVARLLAERTEHGFVFRVDLMLRPFGSAGPVSIAFAAAEDYYQQHGREWERYALVKARPIAGDLAAGRALLKSLHPFVYRRYLDFNAIGSLRELKQRIADDVARKGQEDNVKLGVGGIRELEFTVQAFQLVRGGQDARLRDPRLRVVLQFLGESGLLPPATAQMLDAHYVFLRRLENAIQMYDDAQAHALPDDADARAALCVAMREPGWDALIARWSAVRAAVHEEFRRVFAQDASPAGNRALVAVVDTLWAGLEPATANDAVLEALHAAGFRQRLDELGKTLADLRHARPIRLLSDVSQQRLRDLLPLLLEEALARDDPTTAAGRVLAVVQAIGGRSTYLTLLRESPTARRQLVELCAASPWVSQLLAKTPALLDSLLDPRSLYAPPTRDEVRSELADVYAHRAADDVEGGMDALRRYRAETTLRIAAADVAGQLPLVQVSDRLTWLAEAVLQTALDRAHAELAAAHGRPQRRDGVAAALAVIGYGKFGGIELNYGSDLDLVFVHDCDALDEDTVGGARAISAGAFLTRWVQRVIHWLSTLTPAGRAYEVDLELRPNGRSGLPVVAFDSFARYQRSEAWTWEHQALTRARVVAGDAALGARAEGLRVELLSQARDAGKLKADVLDMRARMRRELDKSTGALWDVKQGEGGLVDLEFITQYLVLRHAPAHPAVARWSDNWRQLESLTGAGVLDAADRDALIAIYRRLRAWNHLRALQLQSLLAPAGEFAEPRAQAVALWRKLVVET